MMVTPLACGEHETKERVVRVMKYKKPMIGILALSTIIVGSCGIGLLSSSASDEAELVQAELEAELNTLKEAEEAEAANAAMEETVDQLTIIIRDEGDEIYSVKVTDGSSNTIYRKDLNGLDLQNLGDIEEIISGVYQNIYEW